MENLAYRLMVFVLFFFLYSGTVSTFGNTSDQLALIDFKHRISQDPLRVMSSWNDSVHFCNWTGVTCGKKHHLRVTFLKLPYLMLAGYVSPWLGNLTFLIGLNLRENSFSGEIPGEFGQLLHLQHLNLSYNSLQGRLPVNLSQCLQLRILNVRNNKLYGSVPNQLGFLSKLVILALYKNSFSGNIPPFIGNISSLTTLDLGDNNLKGIIPKDIGQLFRLSFFDLEINSLSGTIPSSVYNISSITIFSVAVNQLEGHLPSHIGLALPNLRNFFATGNQLNGSIPTSFSNASGLQNIDLSQNNFTGLIPKELGTLKGLVRLNLEFNQLGSESGEANDLDVITYLVNCTNLQGFFLNSNRLRGKLPNSISNFSTQLNELMLGSNLIHGGIPVGIENLMNLTKLSFRDNILSGSIPVGIGNLQNLRVLSLYNNNLSGTIPPSLGNLTKLLYLYMDANTLSGSIPPSLGNCRDILELYLQSNFLNGTIPKEVVSLPSLVAFDVSSNFLSGSPPLEFGSSGNFQKIYLSDNRLSGNISSSLALYRKLEYLYINRNFFEGTIPESLSALRGIRAIDFSHNSLSGEIPMFLTNFSFLEYLNLSFNGFAGEVPREGVFTNVSIISLDGNDDICGGVLELHLPACPEQAVPKNSKRLSKSKVLGITIAVLTGVSLLMVVFLIYFIRWVKRTRKSSPNSNEWPSSVSFVQLYKSTNGFSSDNLIGVGSFGSVYRGVKDDSEDIVAVKVLHLPQHGASKSFFAECKALRNIRHRNLVKIITVCSSVDFQGNDFKAITYEFMPNGSLDKWLHPTVDEPTKFLTGVSLLQRLNIAIDVAHALEYLHCYCEIPIAHCDLKPSNVLLDEGMTAHVGDFGLAKFILETTNDSSKDQSLSAGLKGSIGYIPPEYGMGGQVSILGDVYSYGILLLEMFTGKSPTNDMFQDNLSLHKFSKRALTGQFMEILDPLLLVSANTEDRMVVETRETNMDVQKSIRNDVKNKSEECAIEMDVQKSSRIDVKNKSKDCAIEMVRIGLSCSMHSPSERSTIADVVPKMFKVRDCYLKS